MLVDNKSISQKNLDAGFKVFRLSSSNIKPWDADFDTLDESLLNAIESIKPERSEDVKSL